MSDHPESQSIALRELWRKSWPPGLPDTVHYPHGERPLSDCLKQWAAIQPQKPAVIFYGSELTFAELDRLSDRFAALLAREGIERGDRWRAA